MYYRINDNIALRKWKYVDRAIYKRGIDSALPISQEEFDLLNLCDGNHDLEDSECLNRLIRKGYIDQCQKGDKPSSWSMLKTYDNLYFPRMNLMITGKCNLNCLHCFNAKDNAPLNSELDYETIINLLDQARDIGIHAFTITGGEPLVHKRFLDIVKAIYERDMYVFELNTNGILIKQELLDEFKKIGCYPLIKISFDGIGYHNWMRQNKSAEARTIEAIKLCIANGFKVKAQTQVNEKNYDSMIDTAKMLNELGVKEMRIIRTTEAPRWEKNSPNTTIPIQNYYDKMLEFTKEYIKLDSKMSVDIWQFLKIYPQTKSYHITPIISNANDFNIRIPMCKGNRGMIAISSSGEVVPCLQMSGYFAQKRVSLANIYSSSLKEIITNSKYNELATAPIFRMILENDKCANCAYFKACTGGCPALGLLYSGAKSDYFHEDITKCYFFENGFYDKILMLMDDYKLLNPLIL